jgi:hypothetical protein
MTKVPFESPGSKLFVGSNFWGEAHDLHPQAQGKQFCCFNFSSEFSARKALCTRLESHVGFPKSAKTLCHDLVLSKHATFKTV